MAGLLELAVGMTRGAIGLSDPWRRSIRRFEKLDRECRPRPGSVVFVGSSSFTLWSSLERDMQPLRVVNRGFGGALIEDVVRHADRVVTPLAPSAVVVFVGTNDVSGRHPASPSYLEDRFLELVSTIRSGCPDVIIFYVAITPSRARWKLWPIADEANKRISSHISMDPRQRFIDLGPLLLTSAGVPDRKLYRVDGLHPNRAGYAIWAREIRSMLMSEPEILTAAGAPD